MAMIITALRLRLVRCYARSRPCRNAGSVAISARHCEDHGTARTPASCTVLCKVPPLRGVISIFHYFKERSVISFCRAFPLGVGFYVGSTILRWSFGGPCLIELGSHSTAMLAYSIDRIILSIKAISSSVRPYFLYSISSVHG